MSVNIVLRRFWLAVSFCMFTGVNLPAQESYFPHHLGDMWEYYVIGDNLFEIMQVMVISDSVGQDSFSYIQHYRQFINPPRPTDIPWWEGFVLDTLDLVFGWEPIHPPTSLLYKLDATLGELWIVDDVGGGWYNIARVEDIYPDTLYGVPTTVKEIWYYGTDDTSGIIWLWQYSESLADGFGTISRGGGDLALYYQMFLKGAVIDGVVYGDTTWVGIKQPAANALPNRFQLFQNYPNPFNPNTTIRFILSRPHRITLTIYDVNGKEVTKLVDNQTLPAGEHEIRWDGRTGNGNGAASGIYFYKLFAGTHEVVRRMLLIR